MSKEDKFYGLAKYAYEQRKISQRQYETIVNFVRPSYETNEILFDFCSGLYKVDADILVKCLVRMN